MARLATLTVLVLAATGLPSSAADWERDGLAWRVVLTDDDVQDLRADAAAVARWVPEPSARTAITAAAEALDLVNELGRRNGVEVSGVVGVPGALVWPAAGKTPFVRLVAFQEEARRNLADGARRWDDLTRRVGGRLPDGWAGVGRIAFHANPDGTVSLPGSGAGATRFRLARDNDGAVFLLHLDGHMTRALPSIGPVVRAAGARVAGVAGGVARWTIKFGPDGAARLIPSFPSVSSRVE